MTGAGRGLAGWIRSAAVAFVLGTVFVPLQALTVRPLPDSPGVLLAYDCGKLGRETCTDPQRSIHVAEGAHPGDARLIDDALRTGRFHEVWLVSGGGHLAEGLAIGRVLRRHGVAVRVPRGHACVSACTVAFLGGVLRTVDDGATYEVHAKSRYLASLPDGTRRALVSQPREQLRQLGTAVDRHDRLVDASSSAAALFLYLQEMLRGRPDPAATRRVLQARSGMPPFLDGPEFDRLAERVRAEGAPAAHEAALWLERMSVESVIADLRPQVDALGPRAEHALRLLETMYTSRIHLTASLSAETLLRLGIVTRDISLGATR